MSNPVPQQSRADAVRSDAPSAHPVDRPLPEFQPHTPIEREIERSERASAALAATRALARAAFTDSQLAAADEADAAINGNSDDGDIDTSGWIRTEYAALDHSVVTRDPRDEEARGAAARNLVGGSFNPGIASQHGRAYPGASIAQSPIKTRTGAHARFMQESRHTPRAEPVASATPRVGQSFAGGSAHYDKPTMIPMLATPTAAPAARTTVHAPMADPVKFALAAGVGAVAVLVGGGIAWKAGMLSHSSPTDPAVITARVVQQVEAARLVSAQPQEIAAPAPGGVSTRSNEEVDAALAAAARAAAVPMASVHAAGPSRVARAQPPAAAPATAVATARPATAPVAALRPATHGKDSVAAAIANAQARADSFLASGGAAPVTPAPSEAKKPD